MSIGFKSKQSVLEDIKIYLGLQYVTYYRKVHPFLETKDVDPKTLFLPDSFTVCDNLNLNYRKKWHSRVLNSNSYAAC